MTRNRRRIFWPALLIALLGLTALTFVASGKLRGSKTTDTKTSTSQNTSCRARLKRPAYVRRGNLSPELNWYLNALGDRLEEPGRRGLSVTGTLSRANSQAEEVTAVWEFPDRLRLTMQKGNQARVIAFDGEQVKAAGNPLDEAEQDLIETLVYGSAEHFFDTQMEGMATRFLGSRFRLDDGSSADYSGPYYDVYKIADTGKDLGRWREQLRLYYFNSDTLLLERVTYEITRNGATIKVEERLGDWTREQGQQVARRIERFENASRCLCSPSAPHISARVLMMEMFVINPTPPEEKYHGPCRFTLDTRKDCRRLTSYSHFMFSGAGAGLDTTARFSTRRFLRAFRY